MDGEQNMLILNTDFVAIIICAEIMIICNYVGGGGDVEGGWQAGRQCSGRSGVELK